MRLGNNITEIGSAETGTNNSNEVFQINERLTWLRGRHTLKFGGSWNYYQSESVYPGNNGLNGFIAYNGSTSRARPSATSCWTRCRRRARLDGRPVDAPPAPRRRSMPPTTSRSPTT